MPSGPSGTALVNDLQCGRSKNVLCSELSKDAWGLQFARLCGEKLDLKAHDDEALAAAADEYWCEGQTCRQHEALP